MTLWFRLWINKAGKMRRPNFYKHFDPVNKSVRTRSLPRGIRPSLKNPPGSERAVFSAPGLEVKPQRQLDLAIGPGSHLVGNRRGQCAKGAAGRALRVGLARLQDPGRVVQTRCAAARSGKDRAVEDVVALNAEFEIHRFFDLKLL